MNNSLSIVSRILLVGTLGVFSQILPAQSFLSADHKIPVLFTGASSMDVLSADLDGNGWEDLVIACEFRRNLILWNDGKGKLDLDSERLLPKYSLNHPAWGTGQDSEDVAAFDVEGDGDLDLLFVSEDSESHELLFNDGKGNFSLAEYQFPSSVANALALLDLNGDQLMDVMIGNNGPNQVYLNLGEGNFEAAPAGMYPPQEYSTQDLKVADLDGDGDLDLIEANETGVSRILFWEGDHFKFQPDALGPYPASEARKVVAADVDQDGDIDLYFCHVAWQVGVNIQDRLFLNDGKGNFVDKTQTHLPHREAFTLDALLVDVNHDQFPDLLTTGLGAPGSNHQLWINDGHGRFLESAQGSLPSSNYDGGIGLWICDLDKNQQPEIYFANHGERDWMLELTHNP